MAIVEAKRSGELETPPPPVGSPVDRLIETQLEQWLVDQWDDIDFGAPLQLYRENDQPVGQQYDTGVVGRIDLLCEDRESGALVVMELKRGRQSDVVIGQLARYMGWVKEHLADGREVEGIVLTREHDDRLRYAAMALPNTRLLRYQTNFQILPAV